MSSETRSSLESRTSPPAAERVDGRDARRSTVGHGISSLLAVATWQLVTAAAPVE